MSKVDGGAATSCSSWARSARSTVFLLFRLLGDCDDTRLGEAVDFVLLLTSSASKSGAVDGRGRGSLANGTLATSGTRAARAVVFLLVRLSGGCEDARLGEPEDPVLLLTASASKAIAADGRARDRRGNAGIFIHFI